MNLVVFDIETTGFSPRHHEIIQIAAVRRRDGKICHDETFSTFIKSKRRISKEITAITGIDASTVACAPCVGEALEAFSRFVGNEPETCLVAHNGRKFDFRFLEEACKRLNLGERIISAFDSIDLSRRLWKGVAHDLDSIVHRLKIPLPPHLQRHDARGDVHLLAQSLSMMREGLKNEVMPFLTKAVLLPLALFKMI